MRLIDGMRGTANKEVTVSAIPASSRGWFQLDASASFMFELA
jgi:hypothetical protein